MYLIQIMAKYKFKKLVIKMEIKIKINFMINPIHNKHLMKRLVKSNNKFLDPKCVFKNQIQKRLRLLMKEGVLVKVLLVKIQMRRIQLARTQKSIQMA